MFFSELKRTKSGYCVQPIQDHVYLIDQSCFAACININPKANNIK